MTRKQNNGLQLGWLAGTAYQEMKALILKGLTTLRSGIATKAFSGQMNPAPGNRENTLLKLASVAETCIHTFCSLNTLRQVGSFFAFPPQSTGPRRLLPVWPRPLRRSDSRYALRAAGNWSGTCRSCQGRLTRTTQQTTWDPISKVTPPTLSSKFNFQPQQPV